MEYKKLDFSCMSYYDLVQVQNGLKQILGNFDIVTNFEATKYLYSFLTDVREHLDK